MTQLGAFPLAGNLLGGGGNDAIVNKINNSFQSNNFFGNIQDDFTSIRKSFVDTVIRDIRMSEVKFNEAMTTIDVQENNIKPLETLDDLRDTPSIMFHPIITYAPVLNLLKQGRISGFGFDPEHIDEEDVYGRLINNGRVDDVMEAMDENGIVTFKNVWYSDDPVLTRSELDAIERTRDFVDTVIRVMKLDPTNPDCDLG
jgi:hypothetical protein